MTKTVDLVIVIDTSGSMKDEATDLSQAALKAIEGAASSCPCDLRVEWFGIEGRWKNTKFERRIRDYLLTECNVSESDLRGRKRGSVAGAGAQEDAARTIEDVSKYFNWREGANKAIFYLGDEALEGGGAQTTDKDIEAANLAIAAAKTNQVIVHTYFGTSNSKYRDGLVSEYARLAAETQGQAFTAQGSLLGFQEVLRTVICSSQIEISSTTEADNTDNGDEESSPEMVESSVLGFDGKDDYIEIPYQPHLSPNQFTLSCWAKVTGKQKQWRSPVTCRREGPLGGYILYAGTNNKWQFWTGNGKNWVNLTGPNVVLRAWTHLAATYDGSQMTLYVNGEQVGTPVESKIHLNQRFPLRIGAGRTEKSPDFFFMGQIAEVRLWNQVRSEAEIKQLMNRRLTGNEAGLVGYWPLNEGNGTTVKDLTGRSPDCNISGASWKQVKIPLQETPATTTAIAPTPEDAQQATILWEIGKSQGVGKPKVGGSEFLKTGSWTAEYNYEVGSDADPINSPNLPGIITAPGSRKNYKKAATEKLNIHFSLERDYAQEQLTLFYDRYGAEEDSLFLDGNLLTQIAGKGEGKLQQSQIKLGALSQGKHTLTITTKADPKASDKAHQIDYLKLQVTTGVDSSPPQQTNAPSSGNFVLSFDGIDDYVEIAEPFKNNTAFTISLWVNPSVLNDGGWHGFIGKQEEKYRKPGLWICPSDSGLHYDSYDLSGQRYFDLLPNFFEAKDQWVHIAWVKQGTEYIIYRNGEPFATKAAPEQFYTIDSSYWIGQINSFFAGYIAEVRIWSQARTQSQIQSDMSHRLQGNEAGLVGYWPVNEGSGSIIQDNTGNSNNGNISGATWEQMEIPIEPTPGGAATEMNQPSQQTTESANIEKTPGGAATEMNQPSQETTGSANTEPTPGGAATEMNQPSQETTESANTEESSQLPLVNNGFSLPLSPVSPTETSPPSQQTNGPATTEVSPEQSLVNDPFLLPLSPVPFVVEVSPEQSLVDDFYSLPLSPVTRPDTGQSSSNTTGTGTVGTGTVKDSSTQRPPQSKILSIDGGGIRGIIPAMILAEIEKRTQQPIHRLFDLIAGTSTGGILALGLTKPSSKPNEAGQPTAQYSAAELVEMYVEYGGLMFYESLCGKIIGPVEDVFVQPKFSSEAKEEVITKYLGNTDLTECLKEVLIVSYDLEKRIPVFFTSNSAKQQTEPAQYSKLCQGVTLKDAAMATSATPTYFKPYPVQAACNSTGCYSYTLVDGGIVANNPARLAMMEAGVAEDKKQNDTLLLSLGAGCLTSVSQYKDLKNWGLLQWTIPLLNTVFDGSSKLVAGELERLFDPAQPGHPGSYYRFQTCLREELEALDNTLLKNIKGLQDSAHQLIKQKTREIDQLCEVLASSVSRS